MRVPSRRPCGRHESRSWPPLVRSVRTNDGAAPLTGFVLCALAFSTLLSSQGAGAHLRRTLVRLQGNRYNLPGSVPFVNSVRQNFADSCTCPATLLADHWGSLNHGPSRTARGPSWKDFLVAPPDLARFRVHPLAARRTLRVLRAFVKSNGATSC